MKIIINADDFGHSENINSTTLMLHKAGIVKSATVIAAGKYFEQAVEISKDNPALGIGVHLCLSGPFNIGDNYNTLLDDTTNHFFDSDRILENIRTFSVDESEIYREHCLQIEKVLDYGIKVSHLDHHQHLHLYLPVLKSMLKASKKYKIRYIRSQKVLLHNHKNFLYYLYRNIHQIYLKSRIKAVDGYYSPSIRNNLEFESHYERLSELLLTKNKIIEIMLHPNNNNDPETLFFSDKKVRELLVNHELINYNTI